MLSLNPFNNEELIIFSCNRTIRFSNYEKAFPRLSPNLPFSNLQTWLNSVCWGHSEEACHFFHMTILQVAEDKEQVSLQSSQRTRLLNSEGAHLWACFFMLQSELRWTNLSASNYSRPTWRVGQKPGSLWPRNFPVHSRDKLRVVSQRNFKLIILPSSLYGWRPCWQQGLEGTHPTYRGLALSSPCWEPMLLGNGWEKIHFSCCWSTNKYSEDQRPCHFM